MQASILAGKYRRRRLPPVLPGVRPTTAPIRETIFNWLSPYIEGANCLDLFAGTGALGLEALSRGAQSCVFVDHDEKVLTAIDDCLKTWGCEQGETHLASFPTALTCLTHPFFDIIFLDPPYQQAWVSPAIAWLEANNKLKPTTQIVCEWRAKCPKPEVPPDWHFVKLKKRGRVNFGLVQTL